MGSVQDWLCVVAEIFCFILSVSIWECFGKWLGYKDAGLPSTKASITVFIIAGFLFGFFNTFGLRAFQSPMIAFTIFLLGGLTALGWSTRKPGAKQKSTSEQPL